jgi:hypothetical protein
MRISNLNSLLRIKSLLNMQFAALIMIAGILVSAWMTSLSYKKFIESKAQADMAQEDVGFGGDKIEFEKKAMNSEKIEEIARVVQMMHPQVSITPSADKLILSAKSSSDYERWFLAMLAAQNYGGQKVMWNVPELCMGKCSSETALYAVLEPFTRDVKSKTN